MSEQVREAARPTDLVGRALFGISKLLAVFGGILACALAIMVVVSVVGRYLFASPVPGDYDIAGILCGSAVFAFLPYCQFMRNNVMVDFFTIGLRPRFKMILDAFGTLLYLCIAIMFTWRLYYGMIEFRDTHQVLATVNIYRWWTIPFDLVCLIVLIAVIAYTLASDINDVAIAQESSKSASQGH